MEAHRLLGPGLLESPYEQCLALELSLRNLSIGGKFPFQLYIKA
jgi:GxxExxY protein